MLFGAPLVSALFDAGDGNLVVDGKLLWADNATHLVLAGRNVTLTPGSSVDTGAGDIDLRAQDTADADHRDASASIVVTGATISGGTLTISAVSEGTYSASGENAAVQGSSTATVVVTDSVLRALGGISLVSSSTVNGSATALGSAAHTDAARDAATATVLLGSTSIARITGSSSVVTGGLLSLLAANRTDATALADASLAGAGAGIARVGVDRTTRAGIEGGTTVDCTRALRPGQGPGRGHRHLEVEPSRRDRQRPEHLGDDLRPRPHHQRCGPGRRGALLRPARRPHRSLPRQRPGGPPARDDLRCPGRQRLRRRLGADRRDVVRRDRRRRGDHPLRPDDPCPTRRPAPAHRAERDRAGRQRRREHRLARPLRPRPCVAGRRPGRGHRAHPDRQPAGPGSPTGLVRRHHRRGLPLRLHRSLGRRCGRREGALPGGARGRPRHRQRRGHDSDLVAPHDASIVARTDDDARADATGDAGSAITLSTVSTRAVLSSGPALEGTGDLLLSADQTATARTTGSLVALTFARHTTTVRSDRAVTMAGGAQFSSTGRSTTSARTLPTLSTPPVLAAQVLAVLRSLADEVAAAHGASGSGWALLPETGVAPVGSVAINAVDARTTSTLPDGVAIVVGGPLGVPVSQVLSSAATVGSAGGSGAGDDRSSVAVNLVRRTVIAVVSRDVHTSGDLTVRASRGPPAAGSEHSAAAPQANGSTVLDLVSSTIRTTVGGITTDTDPQTPAFTPPAGSVLLGSTGGSVRLGAATLVFRPGALAGPTWILVRSHAATGTGLLATSDVFDLLAFDATTGAPVTTFAVAPILSVAVGSVAGTSSIWYLDPATGPERIASTSSNGVVSAALPHFSTYVVGSTGADLLAAIAQVLADIASGAVTADPHQVTFTGTRSLGGVLTISGLSVTFAGLSRQTSGTDTLWTGEITLTATGATLGTGTATLLSLGAITATYTLSQQVATAGTFSLTAASPHLTLGSMLTADAASVQITTTTTGDTPATTVRELRIAAAGVTATVGGATGPSATPRQRLARPGRPHGRHRLPAARRRPRRRRPHRRRQHHPAAALRLALRLQRADRPGQLADQPGDRRRHHRPRPGRRRDLAERERRAAAGHPRLGLGGLLDRRPDRRTDRDDPQRLGRPDAGHRHPDARRPRRSRLDDRQRRQLRHGCW